MAYAKEFGNNRQLEQRGLIPMYKKTDLQRMLWMTALEVQRNMDKFIPIKYDAPNSKKYNKLWYWIRYILAEDILKWMEYNECFYTLPKEYD